MSARTTDGFFLFPDFSSSSSSLAQRSKFSLAPHQVKISKNGIEFFSKEVLEPWTELKVELRSANDDRRMNCHGVVVACRIQKNSDYLVTLLFTDLTAQTQDILDSFKYSF